MSNDIVIKVENLYKEYRLGTINHGTLTQDIQSWWARVRGKEDPNSLIASQQPSTLNPQQALNPHFLALNDVSFDVKQGDALGIIGRNGAGKSTLLKILSQVTSPTKGEVKLRGRVASLLEVGTGFHHELTGRENVFLNGAILGMNKAEIARKFDEIVAFAEIEKFIDTPVKRYSSGMYVRLAFAVAAHLEPEILIVDEVLAVGDAQFQKKCLGKMEDVGKEGRTVLFVSHNMQAVQNLCSRVVLLNNGGIVCDENTDKALNLYSELMRGLKINSETGVRDEAVRRGMGAVRFTAVEITDVQGNRRNNFEMGETIRFRMGFEIFRDLPGLAIYIGLRSGMTREMLTSVKHVVETKLLCSGCKGEIVVDLPEIYLRPGEYPLYFHLSDAEMTATSVDVLDDLTAPLYITAGDKVHYDNFDTSRSVGFFCMPSSLISHEISQR